MAKDPICGMNVREDSPFTAKTDTGTFYFCSKLCLRKYLEQNKMKDESDSSCPPCIKTPFYLTKTIIAATILFIFIITSYAVPILIPFRENFILYFKTIWWAILLGLLIGGVIDYCVPGEYISHILAKPKKRTILYSVILGFLMSTCSHGILALSIELHKKGASNPAVIAFLLASPWANMTVTIMLIGFFGLKALYIILCAILIAILTGLIYQMLERRNLIEINKNIKMTDEDFSVVKDIKKRIKNYKFSVKTLKADISGIIEGAVSLSDMVLWWILIGMTIASLAGAYIPPHIFEKYMGPTVLGLLVTLLLATIIEVCSEGSSPMAFEIFRQTGAFGNSFVFLMAGVVTDYTEIGLLWHNVGRKTAIWLPVITIPQVLFFGALANILF